MLRYTGHPIADVSTPYRSIPLEEEFKRLMGRPPRPFQVNVAETLLRGCNLALVAPTGAGKTLAAVFPFLVARAVARPFADRLIYVLPLRSLVVQIYRELRELVGRVQPSLRVGVQTGDQPEDPYLESDVVVTTLDQFLSGCLQIPVSLPDRVANLLPGCLLGAYVVLDEFHLFGEESAQITSVLLLNRMRPFARFLMMSATLSQPALEVMSRQGGLALLSLTDSDIAGMPELARRDRHWTYHGAALRARDVLSRHKGRSVVICNTVARSQEVFQALREDAASFGISTEDIYLLHSRFLPEHRSKKERRTAASFGPGANGQGILVATQVVEAGMDFSCDVLHTELAPAKSLVQRAGRCARYSGQRGEVHVYELSTNDRGDLRYGPYRTTRARAALDATRKALSGWHERSLGFQQERELVDLVHGEADRRILEELDWALRSKELLRVVQGQDRSALSDYVRDIRTVTVLIHSSPEQLPPHLRVEAFSVPPESLMTLFRELERRHEQHFLKVAQFAQDESYPMGPEWMTPDRAESLRSAVLACIAPTVAAYDGDFGLRLGVPGHFESSPLPRRVAREPYSYVRETWIEHAVAVVEQARSLLGRSSVALERLSAHFNLSVEGVEQVVLVAAVLHDLGKLTEGWQEAALRWQQEVVGDSRTDPLAHTDYDPALHARKSAVSRYRRPSHSVEGACASARAVPEVLSRWLSDDRLPWACRLILEAIARHHGARQLQPAAYCLRGDAPHVIGQTLYRAGLYPKDSPLNLINDPGELERRKFCRYVACDIEDLPFLQFILRVLRLADQRSQRDRHPVEDGD
jgi:CRISPR-associated endonuclease/helicase Cas3